MEKYIGDAILQKTYTVDFLQKKRAVNDGIVPQYYVENSHEAIIPDQIFMEVQAEIARRAAMRKASGGRTVYCSKYALSGTLVCGECGSPYGRTHWNPHGKKVYVWKCRKRSKEGPTGCDGRNLHEEDVHAAVVQAIRQTICNPDEEYRKISKEILCEAGGGCQGQIEAIDRKLTDLQALVVEKVKDNDQLGSLVDEIQALREKKAKLTEEQALYTRNEERITALRKELESSEDGTLAYDDKLVRDFVEKIEVFPDSLRFTMKAGMVTEVKM